MKHSRKLDKLLLPMSTAIVIPSYNSAPWLRETLESALHQTRGAAEVLVVDDGSTDETAAVLAPFEKRVRCLHVENGGVARARNLGAAQTQSEWLLFLDSDDRLLPHAAEALVAAARDAGCAVAYGRTLVRGRVAAETHLHGHPSAAGAAPHPARANFKRSVITTPGAAVVRRDVFERVGGFFPGYEPMEDRDFWMKCGVLTGFAFCDTVVLDKTFREGSAGSQFGRRIESGLRAQLAFLPWCEARGINPAFLGKGPAAIVDQAFREAIWHRCWEIIPALRQQAEVLGIHSFWYHRAGLQARAARMLTRSG